MGWLLRSCGNWLARSIPFLGLKRVSRSCGKSSTCCGLVSLVLAASPCASDAHLRGFTAQKPLRILRKVVLVYLNPRHDGRALKAGLCKENEESLEHQGSHKTQSPKRVRPHKSTDYYGSRQVCCVPHKPTQVEGGRFRGLDRNVSFNGPQLDGTLFGHLLWKDLGRTTFESAVSCFFQPRSSDHCLRRRTRVRRRNSKLCRSAAARSR